MNSFKVVDCDVIYLSYDEPNAEENYTDLLTKIPWAKRVHGIHGSDAAHKECAKIADTERFIVIDGDNKVRLDFVNQEIRFVENYDISKSVISWRAKNVINNLIYGNGGIKCWPRDVVLNMKTHEIADKDDVKSQVEFCWNVNYIQVNDCMSDVYNNATPQQAWRAGFREGVKMSLVEGSKVDPNFFTRSIPAKNLNRLLIWMNIGLDIKNGIWAIYGARHGCYLTNCVDWNYFNVRDFQWLNNFWEDNEKDLSEKRILPDEINRLGEELNKKLNLPVNKPLNINQSKFFKMTYTNPSIVKNNLILD